jgi:hypothetical protein
MTLPTVDGRVPIPDAALTQAALLALALNAGARQLAVSDQALSNVLSLPEPILTRLLEAPAE